MSTPESDDMQAEYITMWAREKAKKKMEKQKKKLLKFAKSYFGEDIAIIYAHAGAVVVDENGDHSIICHREI